MADDHWLGIFEDRYGAGSHRRLITLFEQPCVTFAEIGHQFGVTRERVRQWHLALFPEAPRGHARKRLCATHRKKRRLFEDPLFRSFYRHARPHIERGKLTLVRTRNGYANHLMQLDRWLVAMKQARRHREAIDGKTAYVLMNSSRRVDYIYYWLDADEYLLLPKAVLPFDRTTFVDTMRSKYQRYRNTFDALLSETAQLNSSLQVEP